MAKELYLCFFHLKTFVLQWFLSFFLHLFYKYKFLLNIIICFLQHTFTFTLLVYPT